MRRLWITLWLLVLGACVQKPDPLAGISDAELCGTADVSLDLSPAPVRVRSSGSTVAPGTSVSVSGAHLPGAFADLRDDLHWTESAAASFKLRFESVDVLRTIVRRCGATLPESSEQYALVVRPNEALVAGTPRAQAMALATLRQLLRSGTTPAVSVLDAPVVPKRMVIEGFYGQAWSWEARREMLRLATAHKLNTYYYAPKSDYLSSIFWRQEPFSDETLAEVARLTQEAADRGVDVCWAMSPGGDIIYGSAEQRDAMTRKLTTLFDAGVRCFVLAFDDTNRALLAEDQAQYPSFGAAQTDFLKFVRQWLASRPAPVTMSVVPNTYSTKMMREDPAYVSSIAGLPKDVEIGWTGEDIVSPSVTAADVAVAANLFGRPPALGDNYPVRDGAPGVGPLLLQPIDQREPAAMAAVSAYGGNAMVLERTSIVALASLAELAWNPQGYDPQRAFRAGLRTAAGVESPAFAFLAEHSEGLNLGPDQAAPKLRQLLQAYASDTANASDLEAHFHQMSGLGAAIASVDPHLVAEVQPWVDKLARWGTLGEALLEARRQYPNGGAPVASVSAWNEELAAIQAGKAVIADAPMTAFARAQIDLLTTR